MKLADRTFKRTDYTKPSGRSLYGWRINPVTHKQQFHFGEDYSTHGENWALFALEKGIVVDVGFNQVVGNYVNIEYPRLDLRCYYRHCDVVFVKKGSIVDNNVSFANVGTTGSSTGEHLHLSVKLISKNEYFNPALFDYQEHYINGIWNEQFTRDLQSYFNTTIDGVISGQLGSRKNIRKIGYGLKGSQMVKVLQRQLGVYPNGQLDSTTIRSIQRRLGVYVDGFISPTSHTVRVMQNRLSDGRLL